MIRISISLSLLTVLLSTCVPALEAQSTWDRYRPARLDTVIQNHSRLPDTLPDASESKKLLTISRAFPLRTKLEYGGEIRSISSTTERLIQSWAKARGIDAPVKELFDNEVLFVGEERSYWLPVQSKLVPFLKNEWPKGGLLELYVQFVGVWVKNGDPTWVFVVNGYEELE